MNLALPALALSMVICATAAADTYFVAPNGSVEGDGSRERPWPSIEYALAQVGGGHEIVVRDGVYRRPIKIEVGGSEDAPTIVRAETKWGATIIGSEQHAVWTEPEVSWVVIDGFEVLGARSDGIKLCGDHSVVRNCWVHNNTAMGIASHNRTGNVFERNLVEYNGSHVQFHHGMYISGAGHRIVANIVRHNAGWGLHLYQEIADSLIASNLVYGQAQRPGMILRCPEGGGRNIVVNNTFADNAHGMDISRGKGEVIANNIIIAPYDPISFHHGTQALVDFNLCSPASAVQGAHGISGDPLFVDAPHGVYWLAPGSPAIGAGSAEYAPETDFWGRAREAGVPVDIGCYPFVPQLADTTAREGWYYAWPYEFYPNAEMGLPDLWQMPQPRE